MRIDIECFLLFLVKIHQGKLSHISNVSKLTLEFSHFVFLKPFLHLQVFYSQRCPLSDCRNCLNFKTASPKNNKNIFNIKLLYDFKTFYMKIFFF